MNHTISFTKIVALILFFILILALIQPLSAAIGLANPATQPIKFAIALTATSTPTPTPNVYEIPRWQSPQIEPMGVTTPNAPADHYTLKDWNENSAISALDIVRQRDKNITNPLDAYQMLLVESYIRFPQLFTNPALFHELAYEAKVNTYIQSNPNLSELIPAITLYSQIFADALNNDELQPEEMDEWIPANMGVEIKDSAIAENLYGDDSHSWIFGLSNFWGLWHMNLIVTQKGDGTFQIVTFQ